MYLQGRVIIVWLSWLIGGICGVAILLIIICYCRLMPRHQKSFDEQYLKENHHVKDNHSQDIYRSKQNEVYREVRPVSYAGAVYYSHKSNNQHDLPCHSASHDQVASHYYINTVPNIKELSGQYASSSVLDEIDGSTNVDALKTRSLPAFLRPKQRPLSTEDDLQQLYAKVNFNKKYKNRMRNDHAAIIALSKSHSQYLDSDAVIVYDQRTAL